jgi:probable rRNA maturation factor
MEEIEVEAQADGVELPISLGAVESAVRSVLLAEGAQAAELSLTFLDDAGIARLNEEYLDHEGPTDVISFPLPDPTGRVVGDIYIGRDQAARQAAELGADLREELLRLAVHGTLHVLGYEHPDGEGREESPMYRRQEELLAALLRDPHLR